MPGRQFLPCHSAAAGSSRLLAPCVARTALLCWTSTVNLPASWHFEDGFTSAHHLKSSNQIFDLQVSASHLRGLRTLSSTQQGTPFRQLTGRNSPQTSGWRLCGWPVSGYGVVLWVTRPIFNGVRKLRTEPPLSPSPPSFPSFSLLLYCFVYLFKSRQHTRLALCDILPTVRDFRVVQADMLTLSPACSPKTSCTCSALGSRPWRHPHTCA